MSFTVKASLFQNWSTEPIESRRFSIDQDVATNYVYLTQKLSQIFSDIKADDIVVSYIDDDGDRIVVSSDEELTDALQQLNGSLLRLYIKKKSAATGFKQCPLAFHNPNIWQYHARPHNHHQHTQSKKENADSEQQKPGAEDGGKDFHQCHPGVVCDGCNGSIFGKRYKCVSCPDYDLCSDCEGKGLHTQHDMLTIDKPSYQCGGNPWGVAGQQFGLGPFVEGLIRMFGQQAAHSGPWNWNSFPGSTHPNCQPNAEKKEEEEMEADTPTDGNKESKE